MLMTHIRIALTSLRSTRFRTLLTILGIMIGVMAVTLVLALGEGAKQAVSNHVEKLDENIITVRPGMSQRDATGEIIDYNPLTAYAATTLTENDLATVRQVQGVEAAAPLMLINGSVKNQDTAAPDAHIIATDENLTKILKLEAKEGQFLDGTTARDTAVIGEQLSINLFGTDQSLGQRVKIRGVDHIVIGVLDDIKNPLGVNGINFNKAALVSLEAGKAFNQGIAQIQQLSIKTKDPDKVSAIQAKIEKKLLANHKGEEDFTVLTGDDAAQVSNDTFQVIVSMITAIASVSLLVGGIGIMNIMLVSVSERTREIGIRKSLGASNRHILMQFLIESLVMSIIGGTIGFVLAYGLGWLVSSHLSFHPVFEWYILGIALGLSVIIGTVFGLFPAYRAAHKDPIIALRQYQ